MNVIIKVLFVLLLQFAWTVTAQDSLVAHWNFDKVSGDTIYDLSVNANHGTNYGATLVSGKKGKAISFDGNDDYVRIPKDGQNPPAVFSKLGKGSISFWFKADDIPTSYGIAPLLYYGAEQKCDFFDAANKGLIVELGHSPIFPGSKELFFTAWKDGCTYPSFCYDSHDPIPINTWHHIVIVVGDDYNTGYLNGVEMTNRDYNFGDASYSQFFEDAIAHEKMWLGKGHWDRTTQFFDGTMDELKIFDKALSSYEVQMLYTDTGTTTSGRFNNKKEQVKIYPNPTSKTLFYRMNENVDELDVIKITDRSGKELRHISNPAVKGKLDMENLAPGLYYIGFYGNGSSHLKKIIVN